MTRCRRRPASQRPLRGLTLDFYGTLFDDNDGFGRSSGVAVMARLVERGHLSITPEQARPAWRAAWSAALAEGFLGWEEVWPRCLRRMFEVLRVEADVDEYVAVMQRCWVEARPFDDALPALEALRGWPLALVSNADHRVVCAHLEATQVTLGYVVTSDWARAYKPEPEIFAHALSLLGLPPDEVAHVGDNPALDVEGARRAGMRSIWLNRQGIAWPGEYLPPTWEIRSLAELPGLLAHARSQTSGAEGAGLQR